MSSRVVLYSRCVLLPLVTYSYSWDFDHLSAVLSYFRHSSIGSSRLATQSLCPHDPQISKFWSSNMSKHFSTTPSCFATSEILIWSALLFVNGNAEIPMSEMPTTTLSQPPILDFSPCCISISLPRDFRNPELRSSKNSNLLPLYCHTWNLCFAFRGFDQPRILAYTSDPQT